MLDSKQTIGTYRPPRQGTAYLLDGIDDYAQMATESTLTDFTLGVMIKPVAVGAIFGGQSANDYVRLSAVGQVTVRIAGANTVIALSDSFSLGSAAYFECKRSGSTVTIYKNGVSVGSVSVGTTGIKIRNLGVYTTSGLPFTGYMWNASIFSRALTSAESTYMQTYGVSGTDPTFAARIGRYYCNEENGTTGYEASANGNNLTLNGITLATFHTTNTSVTANPANLFGYSNMYAFNGSTQYFDSGYKALPASGSLEVWFTVATLTGTVCLAGIQDGNNRMALFINSGKIMPYIGNVAGSIGTIAKAVGDGVAFRMEWNGSTCTRYINGVADGSFAYTGDPSTAYNMFIGARNNLGTPDTYSSHPISRVLLKNGSGTTLYDTRVNGWGTAVNAPTAGIVPRNEASPTLDVLGDTIQYTGQCPYPITVETPCITGDGSAVHVDLAAFSGLFSIAADFSGEIYFKTSSDVTTTNQILCATTSTNDRFNITISGGAVRVGGYNGAHASKSETVAINTWYKLNWSYVSGTNTMTATLNGVAMTGTSNATTSAVAGFYLLRIVGGANYSAASIASLSITRAGDVTHFPLQGGAGTSADNRGVSYIKSDGTRGIVYSALVGGTVSTIYANRTNGINQDWCINYGGRMSTENVLTYSDDASNAVWLKTNCSITPDTTVAPDGTTTADTMTLTGASTQKYIGYTYAAPSTITFVRYLKAGTHNFVQFLCSGSSTYYANFDVSSGTVGNKGSNTTSTITSVGNGWYRCAATFNTGAAFGGTVRMYAVDSNTAAYGEATASTGVLYLWRARIKLGADDYAGNINIDQRTTTGAIAGGVFMPATIDSSICADDMAVQLSAGNHGNPYSRLNANPFSAAEYNGRSIPTAYAPAGSWNATITPSETGFRRTATDGDDRFLIYKNALTGTDLTNVQAYVA